MTYELWLFPDKERMVIIVDIFTSLLGESIHIELSNVGVHILMFEVIGEYVRGELLNILNDEPTLVLVPSNSIAELMLLP